MPQRDLKLTTYEEIIAEIEHLRDGGYEQTGAWTLGQICRHLSYYMRGSLEGYSFKLPWIIRRFVGRPMLRKIKEGKPLRAGNRTIPASVFDEVDEAAAVAEAIELCRRLSATTERVHPSPIFGELTVDECRMLHTIHAGHHLSFLVPKGAAGLAR